MRLEASLRSLGDPISNNTWVPGACVPHPQPNMWEGEIWKIAIPSQSRQKKLQDLSQHKKICALWCLPIIPALAWVLKSKDYSPGCQGKKQGPPISNVARAKRLETWLKWYSAGLVSGKLFFLICKGISKISPIPLHVSLEALILSKLHGIP
jgi:hypothetical protein